MTERGLFVVCNNCGSEVSPYVTECPYCGFRVRKRAPDLKKQRQREQAEAAKTERQRKHTKRLLTGGGRAPTPGYLSSGWPPIAISVLVTLSVIASIAARVRGFPYADLVYTTSLIDNWWELFTAPLVHMGITYGAICLTAAAVFGAGLERRFGAMTLVAMWLACGAAGVGLEHLVAPVPLTNGAIGIAAGLMTAWLTFVLLREDLRDHDTYALVATSVVLLAMPLATDEASVWTIIGGVACGAVCGLVLGHFRDADATA